MIMMARFLPTFTLILLACLPLDVISSRASMNVIGHRMLQDTADNETSRPDMVRLIPFDVQIAMLDGDNVVVYALVDIISDWMTESFATKSVSEGLLNNQTSFDSIALELVDQSIQTKTTAGEELALFTASLEGVSLWNRFGSQTPPMDPELVELIQRASFLDDYTLLQLLQAADDVDGLGDNVVDVRVFLAADEDGQKDSGTEESSSTNQSLELIIIIAIAVACLAFALLVFAVVWAWRSDRRATGRKSSSGANGASTKAQSPKNGVLVTDGTGSESEFGDNMASAGRASSPRNSNKSGSNNKKNQRGSNNKAKATTPPKEKAPPMEIESALDHDFPDNSVITEDISTSLTAYYKSGMSGFNVGSAGRASGRDSAGGDLNDNASMSSMDSYGYSLDGYAPSLGPTQGGYPVGPLMAARDTPMKIGDDDDVEEPEDYETDPHPAL